MVEDITKVISRLNFEIDPTKYGLRSILRHEIRKDDSGVYILYNPNPEEFDCLTISIKNFMILKEKVENLKVVYGRDEHNLWKNHTYLYVDGLIVDFTPIYPVIGAKHKLEGILSEEDIKIYEETHKISLMDSIPIYYQPKDRLLIRIKVIDKFSKYVGVKLRKYDYVVEKIDCNIETPKIEIISENLVPRDIKDDLCKFIKNLKKI